MRGSPPFRPFQSGYVAHLTHEARLFVKIKQVSDTDRAAQIRIQRQKKKKSENNTRCGTETLKTLKTVENYKRTE